jgi:prepilin-type N-terminal cleavage/methylation domain-containing protein
MLARAKKGFTLLELIVVLLVIGVVAAIAVPTYSTVKDNSVKRTLTSTAEGIARGANADARSSLSPDNTDTDETHVNTAAAEAGVTDGGPWTWTAATGTGEAGAAVLEFSQGSRVFCVDIEIETPEGEDNIAVVKVGEYSCS